MLKKLLKYDLQIINKVLIVFYSLSIFFAILTRLFLNIDNSFIMEVIGKICSGVTISMIFNIIINNLMRCWVRFKQNLYADESYLTHTLPVTKTELYLSKTLASVISLFISIAVITLTLFIAYYSKENLQMVKSLLMPLATIYNSTIVNILLAFIFICFLEIANGLQMGYTGIILGNRMGSAKTGYSILYGFISYIGSQIFVLLLTFIYALFNKDIMNLFYTVDSIGPETIKELIYLAIIIYSVTLIIVYFINLKIFKKGVNVD